MPFWLAGSPEQHRGTSCAGVRVCALLCIHVPSLQSAPLHVSSTSTDANPSRATMVVQVQGLPLPYRTSVEDKGHSAIDYLNLCLCEGLLCDRFGGSLDLAFLPSSFALAASQDRAQIVLTAYFTLE